MMKANLKAVNKINTKDNESTCLNRFPSEEHYLNGVKMCDIIYSIVIVFDYYSQLIYTLCSAQ